MAFPASSSALGMCMGASGPRPALVSSADGRRQPHRHGQDHRRATASHKQLRVAPHRVAHTGRASRCRPSHTAPAWRGPPPRRRGPWPREGNRDKQQRHGREPGQVMTPAIVTHPSCSSAVRHAELQRHTFSPAPASGGEPADGRRDHPHAGLPAGSQVGYSRHPVQDGCQDCLVGVQ